MLTFVKKKETHLRFFIQGLQSILYFYRCIHSLILVSNWYQFVYERKTKLLNWVVLCDQELNDIWIKYYSFFSYRISVIFKRIIWKTYLTGRNWKQKLSLRKCIQWQDKTHLSKTWLGLKYINRTLSVL